MFKHTAIKHTAIAAAVWLLASSAHAMTDTFVKESVALKDGSTVHIFKDGTMGMESRFGHPFSMPEGHAMQAADGRTITMRGNELARVSLLVQSRQQP